LRPAGFCVLIPSDVSEQSKSNQDQRPKRGRPKRPRVDLETIVGRKHVRAVQSYLVELRKLYPHPNRVLFYDDVVVAYLLAFFNPAVRSLRCVQDFSRLEAVNRFFSAEAVCRSTLSEANALFDPRHLNGLIQQLRADLPRLAQQDKSLAHLIEQIVAFDGSLFRVAADVEWALKKRNEHTSTRRFVRLNCAYCQATGVPLGVSVSGDDAKGEGTAAVELIRAAAQKADGQAAGSWGDDTQRIWLFDSGVVTFQLLETILGGGSHVLCNLRHQVGFTVEQEREWSDKDRTAGVVSDRVGHLSGSVGRTPPTALLREVVVHYTDRGGKARRLRLLTDLLDLPAHLIAELYRYRWQVELFFRWLKVHARFRYLMSFSPNGVTLGFYIATIAAMLMCLHTQQGPSKYALNLFAAVACGLATPAEILPILKRRERERELERQRLARKRAAKQAAEKQGE
jgi:hypothetical protein